MMTTFLIGFGLGLAVAVVVYFVLKNNINALKKAAASASSAVNQAVTKI